MPTAVASPAEELRRIRLLWRETEDSYGYYHPALVYAACRLLDPPPKTWMSKNLWLVFYNQKELPKSMEEADPEVCKIMERGFQLYERYGNDGS